MFPCSDEALLFGLSFAVLPQKVCHVQSCKFIAALISENNVTVFTRLEFSFVCIAFQVIHSHNIIHRDLKVTKELKSSGPF